MNRKKQMTNQCKLHKILKFTPPTKEIYSAKTVVNTAMRNCINKNNKM